MTKGKRKLRPLRNCYELWHAARSLGKEYPDEREAGAFAKQVTHLLTLVSGLFHGKHANFPKRNRVRPSTRALVKVAARLIELQSAVNKVPLPPAPSPYLPDPDSSAGDGWTDLSDAQRAWVTMDACDIPSPLCLVYLFALAALDQDLNDETRALRSSVQANLKEHGTPSIFARRALAWVYMLAYVSSEANDQSSLRPNDFCDAYLSIRSGITKTRHVIRILSRGNVLPADAPERLKKAEKTLRRTVKGPIPEKRIRDQAAFEFDVETMSAGLDVFLKKVPGHTYYAAALNALRETLRFARAHGASGIDDPDSEIESILTDFGIDIDLAETIRKAGKAKLLVRDRPDDILHKLQISRAILGIDAVEISGQK